ncbi:MLO-like protein [Rhynchospora pubera]|uniref:MLO-like protein n=1 Tax=Rhynchospora pubera TaxID=906938 RepID=A0AAV8HEJ1_9POAL|nr:MLO-like protein [Rhynchospora pubera]KAJ4814290.1 MLO-like protein [Rhynchospora pubera]
MAGGGGQEGASLEFTPTWIIAIVCAVIIFISLFFERFLHYVGKALKHKKNFALFEALLKVKEELMLLGFISILLSVFQGAIQRICIEDSVMLHGLPCKRESSADSVSHLSSIRHYGTNFPLHFTGMRALLASGSKGSGHCKNGKVPLLSLEAIHQLHIFIFVLALTHVVLSLITVVLGITQMRDWKNWEAKIQEQDDTADKMVSHVRELPFIKKRFKENAIVGWLHSFGKQFYDPITIDDYRTMRLGFIMMHCSWNPEFNFYKYMIRALETDFKKVVGISWYLWALVIVFLLLNVNGWHAYFWISFVPFMLLFVLGAKLEHIISDLAKKVVDQHHAIIGNLVVIPSDDLFWFKSPKLVLFFIHYILFQNAFEIAYFFWILTIYSFDSCIMGKAAYIIPRLIFSVIIQAVCGYSTLPLYAIVSHMGSRFKKAILPDHMHESFEQWLAIARNNKIKGKKTTNEGTAGNKLRGALNGNKTTNGGYETHVVAQSGVEMQEIQLEPEQETEIEIGIHK